MLAGTKPATDRPQQRPAPVVPKIPMPRTPLLAPPPSPLLSSPRIYCPPETTKTSVAKNGVAKAAGVAVSVPVLSAPVVPLPRMSSAVPGRGRVQGSVPRPVLLAPPPPVIAVPASVSQLPRPMKPSGKEPSPPCSKISAARRPQPVPAIASASSAGDAPMTTGTGKSNSPVNKDADDVNAALQDEEMECEMELRGSQQSVSSDEISTLSQGYSSQGQGSNPYSPFNMQKHVDRIMELQQEEDDFNPFVQPNKHTGPFRHPQFCTGRVSGGGGERERERGREREREREREKHVDRIMELQQDEDDFNPFVQPNKHTGPFRHPQFCTGRVSGGGGVGWLDTLSSALDV
ncbi:cleavage and polyadenylation specificity factor subunit 6-like [Littorina saxatilis]|uniref:cleavage and polyadenylation specificity factor subunit 6-like n=1 Tax=Littorina saxatilis TaxID=31220 RepID=UPI0038B4F247